MVTLAILTPELLIWGNRLTLMELDLTVLMQLIENLINFGHVESEGVNRRPSLELLGLARLRHLTRIRLVARYHLDFGFFGRRLTFAGLARLSLI